MEHRFFWLTCFSRLMLWYSGRLSQTTRLFFWVEKTSNSPLGVKPSSFLPYLFYLVTFVKWDAIPSLSSPFIDTKSRRFFLGRTSRPNLSLTQILQLNFFWWEKIRKKVPKHLNIKKFRARPPGSYEVRIEAWEVSSAREQCGWTKRMSPCSNSQLYLNMLNFLTFLEAFLNAFLVENWLLWNRSKTLKSKAWTISIKFHHGTILWRATLS